MSEVNLVTSKELRELKDSKPNITIRDNQNVYVTINNFNETEKEYNEDVLRKDD